MSDFPLAVGMDATRLFPSRTFGMASACGGWSSTNPCSMRESMASFGRSSSSVRIVSSMGASIFYVAGNGLYNYHNYNIYNISALKYYHAHVDNASGEPRVTARRNVFCETVCNPKPFPGRPMHSTARFSIQLEPEGSSLEEGLIRRYGSDRNGRWCICDDRMSV